MRQRTTSGNRHQRLGRAVCLGGSAESTFLDAPVHNTQQ